PLQLGHISPIRGQTMLHMPITAPRGAPSPTGRLRGDSRSSGPDRRNEALGRTAPWLAGLSVACAVIVSWTLAGAVAPLPLAAWAALVAIVNLLILRNRRSAASFGKSMVPRM